MILKELKKKEIAAYCWLCVMSALILLNCTFMMVYAWHFLGIVELQMIALLLIFIFINHVFVKHVVSHKTLLIIESLLLITSEVNLYSFDLLRWG